MLPFCGLDTVTPPLQAGLCHIALHLVRLAIRTQGATAAQLPGSNSITSPNVWCYETK